MSRHRQYDLRSTPKLVTPAPAIPSRPEADLVSPLPAPNGHSIANIRPQAEARVPGTGGQHRQRAGLPPRLQVGVERLAGLPMDDVRVHYDSQRPADLQAHAYTEGVDIHIAPGQERHLPHEAWHVAQQRQGRVRPTLQVEGRPVNADPGLEREADQMGRAALVASPHLALPAGAPAGRPAQATASIIQGKFKEDDVLVNHIGDWIAKNRSDLSKKFDTERGRPMLAISIWDWLANQQFTSREIAGLKSRYIPKDDSGSFFEESGVERKGGDASEQKDKLKRSRDNSPIIDETTPKKLTDSTKALSSSGDMFMGDMFMDESDGEKDKDDALDPMRQLEIIGFTTSGIEVLTEAFTHDDSARRRPIEWKIPFAKWGAGAQGANRSTPTPMSLYGDGKGADRRRPDQDFDPEGRYQKGHMVPASSGAPEHYALTTPMEQFTNQVGPWKQTEEALNRILLKPNIGNLTSLPRPDEEGYEGAPETSLALTIQGFYMSPGEGGTGFVHIEAVYKGEDARIPSAYNVSLYGLEHDKATLLHEFPSINNKYEDTRDKMPSEGLKKLFANVDLELKQMDARAAEKSKLKPKSGPLNQWTPLPPEEDNQKLHPPRGIPEEHVPRPHRSLDAMVEQLDSMSDGNRNSVLQGLALEERQVVEMVLREPRGQGLTFSPAQRDLGERHARYLDPDKKDRFLSDTRKDVVKNMTPVPKGVADADKKNTILQDIYHDPHDELIHGGGAKRPEADHHVPRSTGSGTNHFSNLLWVSHAQNLSKKAQNKPVGMTNPNRVGGHGLEVPAEVPVGRNPGWVLPQEQALTTIAKGDLTSKKVDEKAWTDWQEPLNTEHEADAEDLQQWGVSVNTTYLKDAIATSREKVPFQNRSAFDKDVAALGSEAPYWLVEKLVGKYQIRY